jgi:hypothetical protein
MSDSQPPPWDPASFDDRDLDAMLSGELTDVPGPLGPVAGTIAALRAAPARAELAGEAAARDAFRRHLAAPVTSAAPASFASAPRKARRVSAADRPPHPRPHSHRRRRRPVCPRPWQAVALLGGAAAVAAACAAFAGVFSGPGVKQSVSAGSPSATVTGLPTGGAGSPPVLAGGDPTKVVTPQPTATGPGGQQAAERPTSAQQLCQEYFELLKSPGTRWGQQAMEDYFKLSKLASSPDVYHYCARIGVGTPELAPYSGDHPGGQRGGGHGDWGRGGPGGWPDTGRGPY